MITFIKISKEYDKKVILKDINFKLHKATITTLIGPNGAGKSTLASLLMRLSLPTTGRILYNGDIKIGYVPQRIKLSSNMPLSSEGLVKIMGVKEDAFLASGLILQDQWNEIKKSQICHISGGQLQKLMLAISVAQEPDLLVLDEPLTHLDIDSEGQFYEGLLKAKSRGITIFMISHDLHNVLGCADQVICLNRHVCCSGTPKNSQEIFTLYEHAHDHKH